MRGYHYAASENETPPVSPHVSRNRELPALVLLTAGKRMAADFGGASLNSKKSRAKPNFTLKGKVLDIVDDKTPPPPASI